MLAQFLSSALNHQLPLTDNLRGKSMSPENKRSPQSVNRSPQHKSGHLSIFLGSLQRATEEELADD
jgi:hypothetical protein